MESAPSARVGIEKGVVCGTGGGRELRCDVFTPPAGTANGVGVLLIHGGAWMQGDRSQLHGYGVFLGRQGYTSVACEYRLSWEAKWPAQLEDVKLALRWMRANSGQLGIDPDKIVVSGNSAGGHLSLMLAATPQIADFDGTGGYADVPAHVAAAVAFYPPTNLGVPAGSDQDPELDAVRIALFGDDRSIARIRGASPISYVRADFPPTLLLTGNADTVVAPDESMRMYRALTGAGARAELHVYEGAPHAFDAVPEFGRQCASIIQLFLDRHVTRPPAITAPG
jgi:acetyl esterase/lipase